MIDRAVFREIIDYFQVFPTINALAARVTDHCPHKISRYPDKQILARDKMLVQWECVTYLFPPFPCFRRSRGRG